MNAQQIAALRRGKKSGDFWMIQCPCHNDKTPSLAIRDGDQGRIIVHCHAGCQFDDVLAALRQQGLLEGPRPNLSHAARLGNQPIPTVHMHDAIQVTPRSTETSFDYKDQTGNLEYQVVRIDTSTDGKRFYVRRPDGAGGWINDFEGKTPLPYRLPEVLEHLKTGDPIAIVEGEKCADALWQRGWPATTNPFGAGKWCDSLSEWLRGAEVLLLPDNDDAGRAHMAHVAPSLHGMAKVIVVVELPGLADGEDVFDWLNAGHTITELGELYLRASEWKPEKPTTPPAPDEVSVAPYSTLADVAPHLAQVRWLWPGWIPRGGITLLVGDPGTGKSALALWLAGAVAHCGVWPDGAQPLAEPGRVIWLESEGGYAAHVDRAGKFGVRFDRILLPFAGDPIPEDFRLDLPEHLARLGELVAKKRPDLIVLDALAAAHRSDESEASMHALLIPLRRAVQESGAALLLLHHLRKPPQGNRRDITLHDVRGSGAIAAVARSVIALSAPRSADGYGRRLVHVKSNFGPLKHAMTMEWQEDGAGSHLIFELDLDRAQKETRRERIEKFILAALSDGSDHQAGPIRQQLMEEGYTESSINRAASQLQKQGLIESRQVPGSGWVWTARKA